MSIRNFSRSAAFNARLALLLSASLLVAACDETGAFNPQSFLGQSADAEASEVTAEAEGEFIEEDVEKPDVFYASEAGLWDGRPSLGGVWVAHPEATQPERVIVRNKSNGQFVVSALFRREREIPGPRLQLSSDAAQAIGVLAGSPVELEVVALRKEKIEVTPPPAPAVLTDAPEDTVEPIEEPAEIQEQTLDPIAAAGAAIEAAPPTEIEAGTVAAAATAQEAPQSTLPFSNMTKPYVQVAVFSVEKNAEQVSEQMRSIGLIPTVREEGEADKKLWRVLIGPASSRSERRDLLKQVKAEGYSDAYSVSK